MTDVGKLLREVDPIDREAAPSSDSIARLRQLVVAAETRPTPIMWPRPVLVAATIALALTASVLVGSRLTPPASQTIGSGSAIGSRSVGSGFSRTLPETPDSPTLRQLQFATPGGTRIIWVFDPEFNP